MNIDKNSIMELLRSQDHPQSEQAQQDLPDQIDTNNDEHTNLLAKFGIDPSDLTGKLGGLGKLL